MKPLPSTEERVWAVIAHLSAIAMGMGILLPIVGWSESRRKSTYTSFQCLQALGYQSLGYTVWILLTLVVVMVTALASVAGISNLDNLEADVMTIVFGHTVLVFALVGLYFLPPMVGAVACALGRDFRYPFMGKRLAGYLGYALVSETEDTPWLVEEHEDRWVVSMGHFAVIIVLWGMLAPITAWALQGKRSDFLKFQSVQTLVFQAGTLLLYFGSMVTYLFGFALLFLVLEATGTNGFGSPAVTISVVVFLVTMLCTFAVILFVPLLHILGQWAGYRILKGDDYRYPILGKRLERWLARRDVT